MQIDIRKLPFSKYGSYLALTAMEDGGLLLRNVHGTLGDRSRYFHLYFTDGEGLPVVCGYSVTPWQLEALAPSGSAILHMRGDDELIIRTQGLGVRIVSLIGPYGYGFKVNERRYQLRVAVDKYLTTVDSMQGRATERIEFVNGPRLRECVRADIDIRCEDGVSTTVLRMGDYETSVNPVSADEEIGQVRGEWETYLAGMPSVAQEHREFAFIAWYVLCTSTVRARGLYRRDAVLMSKNWMSNVWSWDHCFNALALARLNLTAGLDQFLLPFDHQLPTGALPDAVNDAGTVLAVVKPPIHGWCFGLIMDRHVLGREQLEDVYGKLARWTNWWFDYRDFDGDGIPNYVHSNDCADNATFFDLDEPIESPDLSAYLVLQMRTLARIAAAIGSNEEAGWLQRAEELKMRLYEHLWTTNGFVGKLSGSHRFDPEPTSLVPLLPLLLGEQLEPDKFEWMADKLEREFLSPYGPVSESLRSPGFGGERSYGMRGPVWAPYVYMLADGLRRGGRKDLAVRMAEGFCGAVRRSGSPFEDYNGRTGEGRDDPAYTWTASVYLLLAEEFL